LGLLRDTLVMVVLLLLLLPYNAFLQLLLLFAQKDALVKELEAAAAAAAAAAEATAAVQASSLSATATAKAAAEAAAAAAEARAVEELAVTREQLELKSRDVACAQVGDQQQRWLSSLLR